MGATKYEFGSSSDYTVSDASAIRVTGGNVELVSEEYTDDLYSLMLLNFNEKSGAVLNDSGPSGINGGATPGFREDGIFGYAYQFLSGANAAVVVPGSDINIIEDFTIEWRGIPRGLVGKETLISRKELGVGASTHFDLHFQDGKLTFQYINGITRTIRDTSTVYTSGSIVHIAVTVDSSSVIRFYKDGVLVYSDNLVASILPNGADVEIGGNPSGNGDYFVGDIDYIRISDTIRADFATGPFEYPTSMPYVVPNTAVPPTGIAAWGGFLADVGDGNEGSAGYQFSTDGGTTWVYYNGSAWVTASGETNDAEVANRNIGALPVNANGLLFRAFLFSDGDHQVQISEINIVTINTGTPRVSAGIDRTIKIGESFRPFGEFETLDELTSAEYSVTGPTGAVMDKRDVNGAALPLEEYSFSDASEAVKGLYLVADEEGDFTVELEAFSGTQSEQDSVNITVEDIRATFRVFEPSGRELTQQEEPLIPATNFSYRIWNSAGDLYASGTVDTAPFTVDFDAPGTYTFEITREFSVRTVSSFVVQPEDFELYVFLGITREERKDRIALPAFDIRIEGIEPDGITKVLTEGDTPLIEFAVLDPITKRPYENIENFDVYFRAKSSVASVDIQFDRLCVMTSAQLAEFEVRLTADNTTPNDRYVALVQIRDNENGIVLTSKRFYLSIIKGF
jgi:hypothetical protein